MALFLIFNAVSVAQAGMKNYCGDTGQQKYHVEPVMLPPVVESQNSHGNHANSYECSLVLCNFFMLTNQNFQRKISINSLRFFTSIDRLVGIIRLSLDRPPKAIL